MENNALKLLLPPQNSLNYALRIHQDKAAIANQNDYSNYKVQYNLFAMWLVINLACFKLNA
jgi:hypothetical protein